ncbi:hypothetical protein I350_01703 [Cryptococcus amylolentus CBS 6273]|uniref:Phospholipase/carboxylesterase/thioesterase domain-containing protein n=1 Tax=Cryptococcus amylolentus CBS 6273 TaxID=1296118 RepID=A0A1E3KDC9_9TREE|nr:hypothetical protein I350_01703 [Cryptococcus amylolentus CBS 6273]
MSNLNLRPVQASSSSPRPFLTPSVLKPWDFTYQSSPDGKDRNLLIMFHGLGDTKTPFFNLAKQLNLPSTAVLSLSAPDPIPLMDHPSYSWYPAFDPFFNPLPPASQNPSKPLPSLRSLLSTLISPEIGWKLEDIHLFGWGQGGTVVLELGVDVGKKGFIVKVDGGEGEEGESKRLGSIVSVCAPLITHPTSPLNIPTPVLAFTRQPAQSAAHQKSLNTLKRAFREVEVAHGTGGGEGMPRGKDEWYSVMKFWGQVLGKANEGWKGEGEVYEVVR